VAGCVFFARFRSRDGDAAGAESIATTAAELGHPGVLAMVTFLRESEARTQGVHEDEELATQAAVAGNTNPLVRLGISRVEDDGERLMLMAVNATLLTPLDTGIAPAPVVLSGLTRPDNLFAMGFSVAGTPETVPATER
jgi:hypothetical protein